MSDAEETVWVIFNGEIYNYRELRAELQSEGHQFRTNSDTEVLIHGYKEWGTDVFNRLNGMFGLAIWDVSNERLVLARDAMGIKLIYYKVENGELIFGSEIRAISRCVNHGVGGFSRPVHHGCTKILRRRRREAELQPPDRAGQVPRNEVRVDVEGQLRIGVRQDARHCVQIGAGGEQQARRRVAQVVEAHPARDRERHQLAAALGKAAALVAHAGLAVALHIVRVVLLALATSGTDGAIR